MISFRSWFDFTRPPPYTPIGEPPSEEKYFQDTAKYWFGNIEALSKFTSLRKPSDMASSQASKGISLVDSRPTTPLNEDDVEQEPLMPRQTVHQPPTASDDGRPEESGLTLYVDLIGFARVLCFVLAAVTLICFSVMGSRLSYVISDWTVQYVFYWIAMGWSFVTAVCKVLRLNVSSTRVRVAVNSRECSLGGMGSSTAGGRLFRKFCMSAIDLTIGILVMVFTADAAMNMEQCYQSYWSCKDTHFNKAVVALGSTLGAIIFMIAFLEPFPAVVSKYICIRMSLGTVSRKNAEDGDIYLP